MRRFGHKTAWAMSPEGIIRRPVQRLCRLCPLVLLFVLPAPAGAQSSDSDSVSSSTTFNCTRSIPFVNPGTLRLNYSATLEAEVAPYIEARVVTFGDSNVVLNPASTGGAVSATTFVQSFPSTLSNLTREVVFTVIGEQVGTAPLQFTVTGGWETPAPPDRIYGQVLELAGGMKVIDAAKNVFRDGFEGP